MENEIKSQMFNDPEIEIRLIEHYRLSDAYTPERLFDLYEESFEEELREESELEANIFHWAGKEFVSSSALKLTSDDNYITATKIENVKSKLIAIYQERFDFDLDVRVELRPEKKSRHRQMAEEALNKEIAQIVKDYETAKKESAASQDGQDAGDGHGSGAGGQNSGNGQNSKNGSGGYNGNGGFNGKGGQNGAGKKKYLAQRKLSAKEGCR